METQTFVLIVTLIIGLLACFMGYRLNRVVVMIVGFYFGYQLGIAFLPQIISDSSLIPIASIVVGIIVGYMAFSMYLLGIFILCFMLAYDICDSFIEMEMLKVIIGAVAGVIAGVIGVNFVRPIMIILTSLIGGFLITRAGLELLSISNNIIYISLGLVLAFLGAMAQFRNKEEA